MAQKVIQVAQFDNNKGFTLAQTIQELNARKLIILSTKFMDERLVNSSEWKKERKVYPARCGPLVAYEETKDTKLGKEIIYNDPETGERYIFPVKLEFQGEKGLIAVEHNIISNASTIDIKKDGKDYVFVISSSASVVLEPNFPREDGWYLTNQFGIPIGEKVSSDLLDARYLVQVDNGNFVGFFVRGGCYRGGYGGRRSVDLYDSWPSFRFGVLALESASGAGAADLQKLVAEVEATLNVLVKNNVSTSLLKPIKELIEAVKNQ
ncbi:MAG: hypothetical protein ABIH99_03330 [Candidatus Micrarchaeota archaeon]